MNIPNSQIHIQIFHRIARLSSVDIPDHGEDGFRKMECVRRYLEVVVPCRFCMILTFLVNRRTGSVCKGLPPSFTVLGNGFTRNLCPFVAPSLGRILESHLRRRRELGSILILLSGFPEAIGITRLVDAIGLDAAEELVALKRR